MTVIPSTIIKDSELSTAEPSGSTLSGSCDEPPSCRHMSLSTGQALSSTKIGEFVANLWRICDRSLMDFKNFLTQAQQIFKLDLGGCVRVFVDSYFVFCIELQKYENRKSIFRLH
jgi:hypothetical protein